MAMKSSDVQFFRPFWRRAAVCIFLALWFLFEAVVSHDGTFQLVTGGLLAYAVWTYLIRYPERGTDDTPPRPPTPPVGSP